MPPRRARRPSRGRDEDLPLEGLPVVAIVGRPNVGKSTLFNRIVGGRPAIVEDRARTTRDRLYGAAEWNARRFIVIDTGGLERRPGDDIEEKVQEQARLAIEEADVILLMVDAAAGETPADQEAAELLRTADAPVLVAANKADNEKRELEAAEFHRLGWEETYPISALHGRGTGDLLDAIVWALPPESEAESERKRAEAAAEEAAEWAAIEAAAAEKDGAGAGDAAGAGVVAGAWGGTGAGDGAGAGDVAGAGDGDEPEALEDGRPLSNAAGSDAVRVAIVGRPNVGKSSLLNALLGEERAIVSELPGTTRDAIDTSLDWMGQPVRLIDTAGMRRRGRVASGPAAERFAALRAIKAISRADVAVLVLDAQDGLTAQDAHVAGDVVEEGVGLVVAINKWDLVEKDDRTFDEYVARLRRDAPFIDYAPVVAISAKSGLRVGRVLDEALAIAARRRRRVPTAELNRLLAEASFRQPPPSVRGRRARFFFATQAATEPPTFVIFASEGEIHFSYRRYLENRLREAFGFAGAPIRLVFRERSRIELEPRRRARAVARRGRRSGPSAGRAPRSG